MSQPTTHQQIEAAYKLAPEAFAALPLWERALYRAAYAADVGSREDGPPYLNRGDDVDRYNALAGAALGSPWCASFWSAMLLDSGCGRALLPPNPASVHDWREWAIASELYNRDGPCRGDVGLMIFSPTEGHLVTITGLGVAAGTVDVIAGNTDAAGGREGFEVARRTYRIDRFDGFVSPTLWMGP